MVLSQLLESTWNVQDFSVGMQEDRWVIPLSPNIHIQILQTGLHTFP